MVSQFRVSAVVAPSTRCIGAGIVVACGLLFASQPTVAQRASPDILAKERSDPAAGETVVIINADEARKKSAEKGAKRGAKKAASKKNRKDNGDGARSAGSVSSANSKSAKATAPNPYAPIKLNPLPQDRQKSDQATIKPQPSIEPPAKPRRKVRTERRQPASRDDDDQGRIERFARPRSVAPSREAAVPPEAVVPERLPPLPRSNTERRTETEGRGAQSRGAEFAGAKIATAKLRGAQLQSARPQSEVEQKAED